MAKIGEGDPRWIVNERADGANVNNWHWTEKNVSDWFNKTLRSKLERQTIQENAGGWLKTTTFHALEVEAVVHNRKGRVNIFIEGHGTLDWEALIDGPDDKSITAKGNFVMPDIDSGVNEKTQVDVNAADNVPGQDPILEWGRTAGRQFVRKALMDCVAQMKAEHTSGTTQPWQQPGGPAAARMPSSSSHVAQPTKSVDTEETSLAFKLEWRCPAAELWDAITNQQKVSAYTRSQAIVDAQPGGKFSVLGGSMTGCFEAVDRQKFFVLSFRGNDWPSGASSLVTIDFDQREPGLTVMSFKQDNIPSSELERTRNGWRANFWEPIRCLFGYPLEYL
eukprot:NODE_870_length_1121_cov_3.647388_g709_i0.p1 GENE.NODE_870_length_1121_cov_3.647388_g709_i0~~NODE_870_length_1121_cov_3.647388_g709_i0.p1  ORF type:complete len:335 (-),score=34.97 NODE_870_length_1121_cov_3.647388_g709_i0:115-1119(-)